MPIEKRPGPDWTIRFQWEGEEEAKAMTVFGAATASEALEDEHGSLRSRGLGYTILAVELDGQG